MEHDVTLAAWRTELAYLVTEFPRCRLHDIAVPGPSEQPCQYARDPMLNWPYRGTLRYRVGGRWRRFTRRDLGYARAGSWKQRAEQPRLELAKLVPRPGELLLVRNHHGHFKAAVRFPLPDAGLAERYEAACRSDDYRELRIRTAVGELLLCAHDLVHTATAGPEPGAALYAAAVAYVEEHLTHDLDRGRVAAAIGCHPGHLSRLFRQHAGEAFTPWVRRRRLDLARRLLTTTALPLAAIAAACGFGSATYLIRRFREAHGTTPQRWRLGSTGSGDRAS